MSNDNYPAGVTDAHPHFNPPKVSASAVECGNDAVDVVPAYVVTTALEELRKLAGGDYKGDGGLNRPASHGTILQRIEELIGQLDGLEQEVEYECPFKDEMELPESECAIWQCPVCGGERETDTLPEEQDPDRGWDDRYDD